MLLLQLIIVVLPLAEGTLCLLLEHGWLSIAGPWYWLMNLSVLWSQVAGRLILCVYIHLPFWMAARPRIHSPSETCKRRLNGFLLYFNFWSFRDVLGKEKLHSSVCGISLLPQPGGIRSVISILQECAFHFVSWGSISRVWSISSSLWYSICGTLACPSPSLGMCWMLSASIPIRQSLSCQGLFTSATAAVISHHAAGLRSLLLSLSPQRAVGAVWSEADTNTIFLESFASGGINDWGLRGRPEAGRLCGYVPG